MKRRVLTLCAALALTLPTWAAAQTLTVSAAASLGEAIKDIASAFKATRPGVDVRINLGASGVLLQQISQGAPADVLLSADEATVDRGLSQKLLDPATRRDFATNALVLVAPLDGPATLRGLADLSAPGVRRIALGKPATVPAGRYAQEVLEAARLWQPLAPKYIYADSVRQVLDYVARGEVDAGLVYRTDAALLADRLRVVAPLATATPIRYPAVVVSDSRQPALARDFVTFLASEPARQVLQRHGFGWP